MLNEPSAENQKTNPNEYPVYPEQEGEWDRPLNPYSPV
jgi:hypothetical protein